MARNGMGPKGWAWLDRCCWMPRWQCAGLGLYGCCCISLKSGSWLTGTPKEKSPPLRNLWRLKCQEMPKASPYKCFAARHTFAKSCGLAGGDSLFQSLMSGSTCATLRQRRLPISWVFLLIGLCQARPFFVVSQSPCNQIDWSIL